jgi:hypothetical protein
MTKRLAVFVSNIARFRSPDVILQSICPWGSKASFEPVFRDAEDSGEAKVRDLKVVLSDEEEYKCFYERNGSYVFNQQIWIIKFPSQRLGEYHAVLTDIFSWRVRHRVVDLTELQKLVVQHGGDKALVNFQDLDFVMFLLFTLEVKSRDERFAVERLLLRENQIRSIEQWERFFFFLPALRYLDGCVP